MNQFRISSHENSIIFELSETQGEEERSEEQRVFSFASRDSLITGNKDDQKIKRAWAVSDSSLTKIDRVRIIVPCLPVNSTESVDRDRVQ